MIKKRLLSFLGAAAITAALTFAVVSLSPSNGFTSGTMQEGLCYEATGVAPDAIVASVAGNGASADLIAYWIGYDVSYLDSYMQYYTGSSLDWDYTLSDGTNITRSKPDPQVFLMAADFIDMKPADCLVVEDAKAGIQAAVSGGFDSAGLGEAAACGMATYAMKTFGDLKDICR